MTSVPPVAVSITWALLDSDSSTFLLNLDGFKSIWSIFLSSNLFSCWITCFFSTVEWCDDQTLPTVTYLALTVPSYSCSGCAVVCSACSSRQMPLRSSTYLCALCAPIQHLWPYGFTYLDLLPFINQSVLPDQVPHLPSSSAIYKLYINFSILTH